MINRRIHTKWYLSVRLHRSRSICSIAFLAAAFLLTGCSNSNPNLGATPTQLSAISFIAPSSKQAGGPDFVLEVNGAGFVSGDAVQWTRPGQSTGSDRATTFVNSTRLTATITADDIAAAGTAKVAVRSASGAANNNLSNFVPFTICPSTGCPSSAASASSAGLGASSSVDDFSPSISASSRYVAFVSVSADPATNASTGITKIYLRDTCAGAPAGCMPQTVLVSVGLGDSDPDAASGSPSISADGRFVTFASEATNLVTADTNRVADIFLRDTCIGAASSCTPSTTRISISSNGDEANGASDSPSISADGRFVAFNSTAGNLVVDGSSAPSAAFSRDTCFGAPAGCTPSTTRIPISAAH